MIEKLRTALFGPDRVAQLEARIEAIEDELTSVHQGKPSLVDGEHAPLWYRQAIYRQLGIADLMDKPTPRRLN